MKGNELKQSVDQALENLANLADEARATVIREWLLFQARFHRYSSYNTWLIHAQCPTATLVAGYRKWQEMGRQVRKGEKGITILVPRPYRREKVDEETGETTVEEGVYFTTGYVFDVSQTEGDPLPEPAFIPVGGQDQALRLVSLLRAYAAERGIAVVTRRLDGKYGLSLGGRIVLDSTLSALGQAAVLAHEIAHEVLHQVLAQHPDRQVAEVEAEAVAFVVLAHFGYEDEAARYLANYVALWDNQDGKLLRARMERIASAARNIIEGLEALAAQARQAEQPAQGLTRAEILRRWERAAKALSNEERPTYPRQLEAPGKPGASFVYAGQSVSSRTFARGT